MELFKSELYPSKLNLIFLFKSNYFPSNESIIKIDISYLTKTPIYPPKRLRIRKLSDGDHLSGFDVISLNPAELWAGKALALIYKADKDPKPTEGADLYSMAISRHIFDTSRIEQKIKNGEKRLNHSHMKTAFILKGITRVKDLFYQRGQNIKSCSKNEFKIQLFPFLRSDIISENEIELMKRQSREFLDRVCSNNWTKKEKEFVHKFQNKGQYCPEILFGKNNSEFKHMYSNQYLSDSAASFHKK